MHHERAGAIGKKHCVGGTVLGAHCMALANEAKKYVVHLVVTDRPEYKPVETVAMTLRAEA